MKHMFMFHVGYLRHLQGEKSTSSHARAISNDVALFIKSLFTNFQEDKQNSVVEVLSKGNCFFVFGLNSQGVKKKIIAAILFSASKDRIWIN